MRKLLLLLCALLGMSGAWAVDVKIASTSEGLPSTFGAFDGQTFTTSDASGLAGVTVTADAGLSIGEQFVKGGHYGNCFKFVTSAAVTDYKVTLTAPLGYVITGYSMDCSANTSGAPHTLTSADGLVSVVASAPPYNSPQGPMPFVVTGLSEQSTYFTINTANIANTLYVPTFTITLVPEGTKMVNVTYELYDEDGLMPVATATDYVEAGSEVVIPSSMYSGIIYNYTTEGTIGNSDCTIKVTRTYVGITDLADLSNDKAYYVVNARGQWIVSSSTMTNTTSTSLSEANQFVLYKTDGGDYYLYSVVEGKFVNNDKSVSLIPQAITMTATGDELYPWLFKFDDSHIVNGQANNMVINAYNTLDPGNKNAIIEAVDFDASVIEALLVDLTPYKDALSEVIAAAEAIPFGTEVHEYQKGEGFDAALAAAQTTLADNEATKEDLEAAAANLQTAIDACTISLPATGNFYRIKGKTSGLYLAAGLASNGKISMTDATDNTTLFYYLDNGSTQTLVNVATGLSTRVFSSVWGWATEEMAPVVTFQDGKANRGYAIQSGDINLYDNGDNTASADRGAGLSISASTNARYCSWALEPVTDVTKTVEVTDAGYATFYFPVAVTIPAGVEAYTGAVNGNSLVMTVLEGKIPANTAVVLKAPAGIYDFASTTADAFAGTNDLKGSVGGRTLVSGSALTLQNKGTVGFYPYGNEEPRIDLVGFKAYLEKPAEVNALVFDFGGETAVKSVVTEEQNANAIYNLAGQRVQKTQKGIFIVNGKKVVK